ncbi:MAG TPA: DUF3857 domain-containing protein [Thermofilum sp.]|nr:DUF3857 domain-containing protein [Thermofilum sp.]
MGIIINKNLIALGLLSIIIFVSMGALLVIGQPYVLPPPSRYSPPEREYREEGYDAVWLVRDKRFTFNGTHLIKRIYYKLKILTDAGADKYFERKIVYNRDWETLIVHSMRTIQPDGTVLEPMPDAIQDIPLVRERIYDNARQRIYQMPGVKVNSIIEANYTIIDKFPIEGEFQDGFVFQDDIPIRYERYTVILPENYTLFEDWNLLMTLGIEEIPVEFTSYDNGTYVWEARNVPAILNEEGRPLKEEIAPAIALSSISSWDEIGEWWWSLVKHVIEPKEEVVDKVRELVEQGKTGVAEIYHWVEKNIKYVALEFGLGGFKPYEPGIVLKNLYGDCKDGASLLVSMLKAMNQTAYLVLINSMGDVSPELPALAFDHAIAAIPLEEEIYGSKWLFLDTTAVTNPYGYIPIGDQGKWALIVGVNNTVHIFTQTPKYPPETNRFYLLKYLVLEETGDVNGMVRWEATGFYDWFLKYMFRMALTEEQKELLLKQYVTSIAPGGELKHYEISDLENYTRPFTLVLSFKASSYASPYGEDSLMFKIPLEPPRSRPVKREWRYYPYILGFPSITEEVGEVLIPEGWDVNFLPKNMTLEKYWGNISVTYSKMGRKIIGRAVMRIDHEELPRWMYNEYVKFLEKYSKRVELPVIITKE